MIPLKYDTKKPIDFEDVVFYPLESGPYEEPPELIYRKDADSNYKVNQIKRYNDYLEREIKKREGSSSFYNKIDWIIFVLEIILLLTDTLIGLFGIINPELSSTTSFICIIATAVNATIRSISKKLVIRGHKHKSLLVLAKGKYAVVKDKYELFLKDSELNDQEFQQLVADYKAYETVRESIIKQNF